MIHLVKVDGSEIEISKEELEKIMNDNDSLVPMLSNSGDKVIIHDDLAMFYDDDTVNTTVTKLVNRNIFGDAIVISLTTWDSYPK